MKTYNVSVWAEEIVTVQAKNKHDAELIVLEGLSTEQQATAEVRVYNK